MRLAALLGTILVGACGGDSGLDYTGVAGRPTLATFDQWVPAVDVSLEGQTHHVLLDSGAPLTLLDTDAFALGVGSHTVDLTLGELEFPDFRVSAFDVINYPQSRVPPLAGLIGGDILTEFAMSLDYAGSRIWLEDDPRELPDGVEPGALSESLSIEARVAGGGRFLIPGGGSRSVGATRFLVWAQAESQQPEQGFWALVDTGASSVVVSADLIAELGLESERPRLDGVLVGTAAGLVTAYFTRMWSLRVGGGPGDETAEVTSTPALVLPDDGLLASASAETGYRVRAIIGGHFLRWFVATLDYPAGSMRLHRYASPAHVPDDEFVGLGFEIQHDGANWVISRVFPESDADVQGLVVGEVIRELDGVDITDAASDEIDEILAPFELGDNVPVGVIRGAEVVALAIAVEDLLPAFEEPL